jgi:threonine dehydratase
MSQFSHPELVLNEIQKTAKRLESYLYKTPIFRWQDSWVRTLLDDGELHLKLEFLQKTGSFKPRGALNNTLTRSGDNHARGVTAVSAGNHAIAVAYAAKTLDVSAKVLMPRHASRLRIEKCRYYGAEVLLVDDITQAFSQLEEIAETEDRMIIHPFDGVQTLQGTGTLGLEIGDALMEIDTILVAVGGGGLISGVASCLKQMQPNIKVIGVEPAGASGLTQSLELGRPIQQLNVDTIADSMGAPLHCEMSFRVCQQVIDQMVIVTDEEMCRAMARVYDELKFALEPAGVAVIAALEGSLQKRLKNQRVAAILCGSNIDESAWLKFVKKGRCSNTQ